MAGVRETSKPKFNELTRVQMPALVHLTRLGHKHYGKHREEDSGTVYNPDTNILVKVFKEQFAKLNPDRAEEADETLIRIRRELNNDDLGRSFYPRLTSASPVKLIDFDYLNNNTFHCTAEFTCKNGLDEFRPDVTLFVNGLPLAFIEVKKPNNRGGVVAESERMNKQRFTNRRFRRFINVTQLMIFSNNMEYDAEGGITLIQGVFYCTGAREEAKFSTFREENPGGDTAPLNASYPYEPIDAEVEKSILFDFNCQAIHTTPEYQTNLGIDTPTNRVLTSMCSPQRFLFLIRYEIAYARMEREVDGKIEFTDQKHIMRYQQLFAALAVREKLAQGVTSGVIWHTQGSGKPALSYHLNRALNDFYAEQNKVAKFYFVVDRLDLLEQATQEFEARGLEVKTANTRAELMEQFRTNQSLEGERGKPEITVVNIQRFAEDKTRLETIIKRNKRDWVSVLSNQKTVYLITDTKTEQMYVGMATSDKGMPLDRWRSYIENGHGGNIELKKLVEEKGFDYVRKNFVYSTPESYNATIDDCVIGEREAWWKQMLLTRKFGYNKN